jgi:hypothetical protein
VSNWPPLNHQDVVDEINAILTSLTTLPGSEIASCSLASAFTPASSAQVDVTGMSLIVPANSGNILVWCPGGVNLTATTGTNANSVTQRFSMYITDDTNPTIPLAFSSWSYYGTGTSQTLVNNVAIGVLVANQTVDRTYRMQTQVSKLGTLGASGSLQAGGGVFPNLQMQAVRR